MQTIFSNEYKYRLLKNTESDACKIILMQTGFTFDKDSHSVLSDIAASELATGNGYTNGGQTLSNISVVKDNENDKAIFSADNVTWTASGGTIATSGAIVYNDTMTDDPIIGFLDMEGIVSTPDGVNLEINNISFAIG